MQVMGSATMRTVEPTDMNVASLQNISALMTTRFGLDFALIVQSTGMKRQTIACSALNPANKMQNTLTLFATNNPLGVTGLLLQDC